MDCKVINIPKHKKGLRFTSTELCVYNFSKG